jgi:hypothetical protein
MINLGILISLFLGLFASVAQRSTSRAGAVLDTEPRLFVDDDVIERMERVTRTLNNPVRVAGNPILKPDQPWEGELSLQPGTVIFDEEQQIFKMWYNSLATKNKPDIQGFLCYATSKDGIHWTKPNLNIVEFHGSKANNIFLKWCDWTLSVIKDIDETNKDRRYKLAYWNAGVWVAFSPDGIHWTLDDHNPVVPSWASGDTFNIMRDPISHQFWMYHKSSITPLRKVSRFVSEDFVRWRQDELVLEPDDYDQPDTEFYGLSPFPYGGQYLGLLWVFHTYAQQMDIQLVSSRDGLQWQRAAHRRTFLPLGFMTNYYDGHAFDSEMICSAAVPVLRDGELWIYYTGYHDKHNAWEGLATPNGLPETYVGQVGVAKLREDGFVSMDATSEGYLLTRPLRVHGTRLQLNVSLHSKSGKRPDASGVAGRAKWPQGPESNPIWSQLVSGSEDGGGKVQVEVEDEKGTVIPGFGASDCNAITAGGRSQEVSWKNQKDVEHLNGHLVRFKFIITNAKLFSFRAR